MSLAGEFKDIPNQHPSGWGRYVFLPVVELWTGVHPLWNTFPGFWVYPGEQRPLCTHTFVGAFQLSPVGAVTLGREHITVHCIGHSCWSDYLGPSSPSPRPISQYCSAQTSQVWNFDWKQRAPVLNAQQTRPRSCSCLLPLCSRWTSPLPTSSMALGWEVVHACHPMTQPPLQEGWGLNFGFFQLQRELNRGLPLVGWTLEMLSPAPFLPSVTLMDSDTDHDNDY